MDWEQLFLQCILQSFASDIADYFPLLLGLQEFTMGKRRFHFKSFWPKLDRFFGGSKEFMGAADGGCMSFASFGR
jgi:hypothetical protein